MSWNHILSCLVGETQPLVASREPALVFEGSIRWACVIGWHTAHRFAVYAWRLVEALAGRAWRDVG